MWTPINLRKTRKTGGFCDRVAHPASIGSKSTQIASITGTEKALGVPNVLDYSHDQLRKPAKPDNMDPIRLFEAKQQVDTRILGGSGVITNRYEESRQNPRAI